MARRAKRHQTSETIQEDAMRVARGTQRPGQTKEQTRLIAKGIEKGIEQYRKQQSARARELDRKLKKVRQPSSLPAVHEPHIQEKVVYRQHWLPWLLLVISWLAMAAFWIVY